MDIHKNARLSFRSREELALLVVSQSMTRFSEVSLRGDGQLRGNQKHPGFLALHVAVDDHSRMAAMNGAQLLKD